MKHHQGSAQDVFKKKDTFDHSPHPGLTSPGEGKRNIMQKVSTLDEKHTFDDLPKCQIHLIAHKHAAETVDV